MIYNFYSYRGELGRSMALARLAECFFLQGLRVVVVDADLEGPGLESLLLDPPPAAHGLPEQEHTDPAHGSETNPPLAPKAQSWPGLVDLFADYRLSFGEVTATEASATEAISADRATPVPDGRIPSLTHYLVPIHSSDLENPFSDGGSLSLLPAGRQPRAESETENPLTIVHDKRYLDRLREQLLREADVVLIDAPRGIEPGIGTHLLSDAVVCFCGADEETLEGTSRMIGRLRSEESLAARDHRSLEIVLVPVRIDPSTPEQENDIDRRFARLVDQSPLPAPLQARGARLCDLQIAYPSEVTFREHGGTDSSEAAYVALASDLALLAPEGHPLRRPIGAASTTEPLVTPPSEAIAQSTAPAETTATESIPSLPTMLELFDEIRRELDAMPEPLVPDEPLTAKPATAEEAPLAEAAALDEVPVTAPAISEATPAVADPTPVAQMDSSERATRPELDRRPAESIDEPKQSLTSRPVVFETTPPPAATSKRAGARRTPAWTWPAAGASMLVLVAAFYLGTRGHGDSDSGPAHATAAAPTAENQPPLAVPSEMPVAPSPPAQDPAPQAAKSTVAKSVASAESHPDPSSPGGMYLRVGWGPSCPRILNYRKQFAAAGIPDAGAVQLKSGGCALVLGPYAPDVVELRRKEHNARRIRGFDNVTVIDDRDFAKWL